MRIHALTIGLLLATGATGRAAPQPPPAPPTPPAPPAAPHAGHAMPAAPTPPAELQQLKFLVGTWKCTGKTNIPGMGEHPTEATVRSKWDLDKFWLVMQYVEKKTKHNPMPHAFLDYWTWDAAATAFVSVMVDNMGGTTTATSKGFTGEKMEISGPTKFMGKPATWRETMTKKSDRAVEVAGALTGQGGAPLLDYSLSCKR